MVVVGGGEGNLSEGNLKEPLLSSEQQSHNPEPRISFNTRVSEVTSDGEAGWKDLEDSQSGSGGGGGAGGVGSGGGGWGGGGEEAHIL